MHKHIPKQRSQLFLPNETMSLLHFSNPLISLSSFAPTLALTTNPVPRVYVKPFDVKLKSFNGIHLENPIFCNRNGVVIVRASSDVEGTAPTENAEAPVESKDEAVSVEKLPLESKEKERMEQKLKMKLARKIRLRRKRLVRKRRLRKKGRWPPSKMKKLKNV